MLDDNRTPSDDRPVFLPSDSPSTADLTVPDGPGWGWRSVGAVALLTVLSLLLLSVGVNILGAPTDGGMASPIVFIASTLVYGAMLLGIYLFAARRSGWAALGLRPPRAVTMLVVPLVLLVGLFGMAFINLSIAALQGGEFENPQAEALTGGTPLALEQLVLLILLVGGFVPVVEELFFRGMIYPLLRRRGAVVAVVGSAAIFAVAHVLPILLPGLFFVGLLMGLLREWSGSVWPSILFHIMQNTLVLIALNAALSATGS